MKKLTNERKVVTIVSKEGKQIEGKVLEYNESVLFQRQTDLQLLIYFSITQQSQRMIKDNYMTADYNVPKLERPLQPQTIKKLASYADNLFWKLVVKTKTNP